MIMQRCKFAEKPFKMIVHNVLLQYFQIQHQSYFGDPLDLKMLANMLLVMNESMQKSMWSHCGISSFKEQKQCLK